MTDIFSHFENQSGSSAKNQVPVVSIIVPTYNRGYCIAQCLRSILDQSFTNFEIIVVDDASNDDTATQVHAISDCRISYIVHEKNQGGAAARNSGIRAARGEFIAFLDSDDYWHVEKLNSQITALQTLGLKYGLSYTWISCVDDHGVEISRINPEIEGSCANQMLVSNFIGSFSNILARRSLLLEVGALDEDFRSCQDWDLFIRLTQCTYIHCLREYAVRYLVSISDKNRISTNSKAVIQGHTRMLTKFAEQYANLPNSFKLQAYRVYMVIFANAGSVGNTFNLGLKRLRYNLSLDELTNSFRLILRAVKYFSYRKK